MNTFGNFSVRPWPDDEFWDWILKQDGTFFSRPWSTEQWDSLNREHHQLFGFFDQDNIIGFALLGHLVGDETAHLLKIYLDQPWRGKRVSEIFWTTVVERLVVRGVSNIYLEVEESNIAAQNFYRKVGFRTLRTVPGYYSNGESGLMMLMTLERGMV